jgi:hypothetical protein
MQRIQHKRSRRRSEEGAVMLVVMLILLTATALAGVSLQATQYELRAAGYNRTALQTQYVSEAAMATTLSWVDATSLDRSIMRHIGAWSAPANPPDLDIFAEPPVPSGNRGDANRTQWSQQARLSNVIIPPITIPGASNDPIGTFGPRATFHPGTEDTTKADPLYSDYVVDMYDCRRLQGIGTAGTQINQGGSGTIQQIQLYCVVTSRGRSFMFSPTGFTGKTKTWQTGSGTNVQFNRYTLAHDSRGTVVSPPIAVQ